MPPSKQTNNSTTGPVASGKAANPKSRGNGSPSQDGLLGVAQAAYSLLADDTDPSNGSESSLGGSQGVVGAAEQQITTDGGAGDKSAPAKQQVKAAGAAGGAARGAAAAGGAAATGSEKGAGAVKLKPGRPRLWSVKKATATVTAVSHPRPVAA